MKAPEQLETERLLLHRPTAADSEAIFARYASDPEVTRYLAWPRHITIADTELFLKFSDHEWTQSPAGPYLVRLKSDGSLLGSSGLAFGTDSVVSTGYVFAKDAWGKGYASECVQAMVDLARDLDVSCLHAFCHAEHAPSARVLEKAGFVRERIIPKHIKFPNLGEPELSDVCHYSVQLS
jgi:ribosomal-protein-alanine N-acetyltransferase